MGAETLSGADRPARTAHRVDVQSVPSATGTYVLGLYNPGARHVAVGAKGRLKFVPGCYWYVGSALGPGGLRARLRRHIMGTGRRHWHIDYLRAQVALRSVWFEIGTACREHVWSRSLATLSGITTAHTGFGASDCRCGTHLYYSPQPIQSRAFRAALADGGVSVALGELLIEAPHGGRVQ